jgi:predicted metalloprotease with PDZ domain
VSIEWNELVLYPAGYFVRRIPVTPSLRLPAGWQFGSALQDADARAGTQRITFKRVNLATLVDSPVYAGRYAARLDLDPGGPVPVHLDLFADRPELLALAPEHLQAYRSLVQQAYRLFGSHHYAHYDFLYSLSDQIAQRGLEHHQSSENGSDADSFTDWNKSAYTRDLLPHEYTHSWNGKFRRPADLWTPNYNVPMQDSLLWVYEGQTQYWGEVLAARSGLWTRQQALDQLALIAADDQIEPGLQWRALQDTTNDEIINPRRPQSWRDWERFEDYYDEGALIWLDVDTLIRERSNGQRSLDDFARSFFGIDNGSLTTATYSFADLTRALNAVQPYDWTDFLRERLDSTGQPAPLDGLHRGGYRLTYTDAPGDYLSAMDGQRQRVTLRYSIGIDIDDKDKAGSISQVVWGSPAFKAGLTSGGQILAVNGVAYSANVLKEAIRASRAAASPIELIVRAGDTFMVAHLDYHGGLRYPHLVRDTSVPPRLDAILAARP